MKPGSFLKSGILTLLLSFMALAQTSRGTVSGIVADTTGAVIAGATVTLTNTQTGLSRSTVTNEEGLYRFDAVDLGLYTVRITATGFGAITKNNIMINANQISQVDTALSPGTQEIAVDVSVRDA